MSRKKWALLVGIDRYEKAKPLRCCRADVETFAETLKEYCGYEDEHVSVLTDRDETRDKVTHDGIIAAVESLPAQIGEDDSFLFYFAGHGIVQKERGYLLGINSDTSSAARLKVTALPVEELTEVIRGIPAREKLLIVDACRDDPAPDRSGSPNPLRQELADSIRTIGVFPAQSRTARPGTVGWLFACGIGERAYEWLDKGHSYFNYHLNEAVQGAAVGPDGEIEFGDVAMYVQKKLEERSRVNPDQSQRPFYEIHGGPRIVLGNSLQRSRWIVLRRLLLEGAQAFACEDYAHAVRQWGEAAAKGPADSILEELLATARERRERPDPTSANATLERPRVPFARRQQADFAVYPLRGCRRFRLRLDVSALATYWRAGFVLAPEQYISEGADSITLERYFLFHLGRGHEQGLERLLKSMPTLHYKAYYRDVDVGPHVEFEPPAGSPEIEVELSPECDRVQITCGDVRKEYVCDAGYMQHLYLLAWADGLANFRVPVEVRFLEPLSLPPVFLPGQGAIAPLAFQAAHARHQESCNPLRRALGPVQVIEGLGELQHFEDSTGNRCCLARGHDAPEAHLAGGAIYRTYMELGGTGRWGLPVSGESPCPPSPLGTLGSTVEFQQRTRGGGRIRRWAYCHETGPLAGETFHLGEGIQHRYRDSVAMMGLPVSNEYDVPGGRQADFEGGSLYWRADLGKVYILYRILDRAIEGPPFESGWHRYSESPEDTSVLRLAPGPPPYFEFRPCGLKKAVSFPRIDERPGLGLKTRYAGFVIRSSGPFQLYVSVSTAGGRTGYVACWTKPDRPVLVYDSEWTLPADPMALDGAWHTVILDLARETEAAFQDRFGALHWFCLRGDLDIRNIYVSDSLDLLTRAAESPIAVRSFQPPGPPPKGISGGKAVRCGRGDNSGQVSRVQTALHDLGYYPAAADGDFGPVTEDAVKRFQSDHRLDPDGRVGRETWIAIVERIETGLAP